MEYTQVSLSDLDLMHAAQAEAATGARLLDFVTQHLIRTYGLQPGDHIQSDGAILKAGSDARTRDDSRGTNRDPIRQFERIHRDVESTESDNG